VHRSHVLSRQQVDGYSDRELTLRPQPARIAAECGSHRWISTIPSNAEAGSERSGSDGALSNRHPLSCSHLPIVPAWLDAE